jgi:hypothetical protein
MPRLETAYFWWGINFYAGAGRWRKNLLDVRVQDFSVRRFSLESVKNFFHGIAQK